MMGASSTHQTSQNNSKRDGTVTHQAERGREQISVLESRPPGVILPQAFANPGSITPGNVLQLQRAGGNRAVSQLLAGRGTALRSIQAKLMVAPANDHYEQEADAVAQKVVGAEPAQRRGVYTLPTTQQYRSVAGSVPVNGIQRKDSGQGGELPERVADFYEMIDSIPARVESPDKSIEQDIHDLIDESKTLTSLLSAIERLSSTEAEYALQDKSFEKEIAARFSSTTHEAIYKLLKKQKGVSLYVGPFDDQAEDREVLMQAVEDGLKQTDRLLVNSCEWLDKKRAKLYALTTTGDSDARVYQAGKDPKKFAAYFPQPGAGGDIYSSSVTYDQLDLTNNDNIEIEDKGLAGWHKEGNIAVVNARNQSQDRLWEIIKHETQHSADKSVEKMAAASSLEDRNLEAYKSEYRAYIYEGKSKFKGLSDSTEVSKYGYEWTEKQLAIFEHIWGSYDHTKTLWDMTDEQFQATSTASKGDVFDRTKLGDDESEQSLNMGMHVDHIRKQIVAYKNPDEEGFNKWNSIRVDDFYQQLDALPDSTDQETAIQDLIGTIENLTAEDAEYILNESPDFTNMLDQKLDGKAKKLINGMLVSKSAGLAHSYSPP